MAPASCVGAHVSACPNHQTGRSTPLETRAVTAMSGTFGFELDPAKLSEDERRAVRAQIAAFHEDAPLIVSGLYYRLSDPESALCCAWEYVSEPGDTTIISAVLQTTHANLPAQYIRPRGLTPGALYRARETGQVYPADALMDTGFPLPFGLGAYDSFVLHLDRL